MMKFYFTTTVKHKKSGKVYKAEVFEDKPQHWGVPNIKVKLTDEEGHSKIVKQETVFRNYEEIKGAE